MALLEFMIEVDIQYYLVLKNMMKSLKSSITFFSPYFAKVKVDSFSSLPIEKILTLQSVIILIKLVLNKYQNHYYYYKIFLEKYSYQLAKK